MGVSSIPPPHRGHEDALRDFGIAIIFGLFLIGGLAIGAAFAAEETKTGEPKQLPLVAQEVDYVDEWRCPLGKKGVKARGQSVNEAIERLSAVLEKRNDAVWRVEFFPNSDAEYLGKNEGEVPISSPYQIFRGQRLVGEISVQAAGKDRFVAFVAWRCRH